MFSILFFRLDESRSLSEPKVVFSTPHFEPQLLSSYLDDSIKIRKSPRIYIKKSDIKESKKAKAEKTKKSPKSRKKENAPLCPVCNCMIGGNERDMAMHVEMCLLNQEQSEEGEEKGIVEYEINGELRVRAAALVEQDPKVKQNVQKDVDDDLNIDEDESRLFGASQYGEKSIQKYKKKMKDDNHMFEPINESNDAADPQVIIAALKEKIKQQESMISNGLKCLICMDSYLTPLVSIGCWHVHCEKCWLKTLAVKKLCPQCNVITGPAELRRIYL